MTTDEFLTELLALAVRWRTESAGSDDYDWACGVEYGKDTASAELGDLITRFEQERK